MDEVRTGGSCEACKKRGMSMGQILGDCISRQFNLLREVNPKAEIFVWSDMLDPNHNTRPEKIQAALEILGKRVVMAYDDAA